ncbi:MAG TPA: MEDS domain-containing protein [Micromonosporaceae bacterium]
MSQATHGDHLCLVPNGLAERQAVLSAFVGDGLGRDERVLYIYADPESAAGVFGFLERDQWRRHLASGQLGVASVGDVYLSGDRFQPDRLFRILRQEVEAALGAGWRGLRVTTEMNWALRHTPGMGRLVAYEKGLHAALARLPAMVVCQYDRRDVGKAGLDRLHPGQLGVDPLYSHGGLQIFPSFDPPGLRVQGAVDAGTMDVFLTALRQLNERTDDAGDSHLDLGELHFIDLDGLRHLAWAASQLPKGRRLALHRLSAHHRELIALLHWDEIPELHLDGDRS